MTQLGKCDTCRGRKVKCDELHPICSGCKARKRPCTYTYGKTATFKGFVDVTQKFHGVNSSSTTRRERQDKAEAANNSRVMHVVSPQREKAVKPRAGVFVTAVGDSSSQVASDMQPKKIRLRERPTRGRRLESPKRLPLTDEARLLRKYISITEATSDGLDTRFIFSNWAKSVVQRIGHSPVIDAAVESFHGAIVTYANPTPDNKVSTAKSNAKALECIRDAITVGPSDAQSADCMLAICMLYFVEIFTQPGTKGAMHHASGLVTLVQRASRRGSQSTEVVHHILDYCAYFEYNAACLTGRNSVFNSPVWLSKLHRSLSFTEATSFDAASVKSYNLKYWVQVPQLLQLVRQAREEPYSIDARTAATEFASQLYSRNHDAEFQKLLDTGTVRIVPTLTPEYVSVVENSLDFSSNYCAYSIFICYWALRSVICGCILALDDIFPVIPSPYAFDIAVVAQQDLEAAEYIAMSVEYSLTGSASPLPINTLRLLLPLQDAFGAWHRLETRAGGAFSTYSDAHEARARKLWCVKVMVDFSSKWGPVPETFSYDNLLLELAGRSEILMGGTIPVQDMESVAPSPKEGISATVGDICRD